MLNKIKKSPILKYGMRFLFAVILVLGLSNSTTSVDAKENSKDVTANLINYYNGKNKLDASGLSTLSPKETLSLGIYMSNYFQGFKTQIVSGTQTSKEVEDSKNELVKTLTTVGSFDEDTAKKVAQTIYDQSASSVQKLKVGYIDNQGKLKPMKYTKSISKDGVDAKAMEWIKASLWGNSKTEKTHLDGWKQVIKAGGTKGVLYFGSPEEGKIVQDWSLTGNPTPSQLNLFMQLSEASKTKGNPFGGLFDFSDSELKTSGVNSSDDVQKAFNKLLVTGKNVYKGDALYNKSLLGADLYVDAFGNIIVDHGARRYVAIPAVTNPFVYQKSEKLKVGESLPISNLQNMSRLTTQGSITSHNPADTSNIDIGSSGLGSYGLRAFMSTEAKAWTGAIDKGWASVVMADLGYRHTSGNYKIDMSVFTSDSAKKIIKNKGAKFTQKAWNDSFGNYFGIGGNEDAEFMGWIGSGGYGDAIAKAGGGVGGYNIVFDMMSIPKAYKTSSSMPLISTIVGFDALGLQNNEIKEFNSNEALKKVDLFKKGSGDNILADDKKYTDGGFSFKNVSSSGEKSQTYSNISKKLGSNFFTSVVLAVSLDDAEAYTKVGYKISTDNLPQVTNSINLKDVSTQISDADMQKEVLKMAYYFLHPSDGMNYIGQWFNTKATGILTYVHNGLIGASNSKVNSGVQAYAGFTGYVTTPSLTDVEWLTVMTSEYLKIGVYLILVVIIIMIVFMAFGELTILQGVKGIIMFSLLLYLPPLVINSTTAISNQFADTMLRGKFSYWALNQTQAYNGKVDETAQTKDPDQYVEGILDLQQGDTLLSNAGNSVTVRWTAPKKTNYLHQIEKEVDNATGGSSLSFNLLYKSVLSKSLSGEKYVDSSNALYLYRSVSDLTNYGRFVYGNIMGDNVYDKGNIDRSISDINSSLSSAGMIKTLSKYIEGSEEDSLKDKVEKGFINDRTTAVNGRANTKKRLKRIYAPLSSSTVSKAANIDVSKISLGDIVGTDATIFDTTLAYFNNHNKPLKEFVGSPKSSEELTSATSFAMFTESPYYYFTWSMYDNGLSTKSGSSNVFKSIMLGDNGGYFYNYAMDENQSGYGDMKDFTDMSSLFHTTIPYLKKVNKPVEQWSDLYGTKSYPGVKVGKGTTAPKDKSSDAYYKYWFNSNLANLYNQYSPWVDTMYDSGYSRPTNIRYGGEVQKVEDPINPDSYKIRPMIFSKSEMSYYGLKDKDLTEVERRIIKVQENTYKDLQTLLNYYTYDDAVLASAYGMMVTFNFNEQFSQNNPLGESFTLYPQSYELKNFSYDAFLRLILAENTDIDLLSQSNETIYQTVISQSGVITGLLMLVSAIIAVLLIPLAKIVIIVGVFILGVIILVNRGIRSELSFWKVTKDAFVVPLVSFLVVSMAFTFVISLMVGNGATGVTGDLGQTVSFNSPNYALVFLILLHVVVTVVYGLIIWNLIKNIIQYSKILYQQVRVTGSTVTDGVKDKTGLGSGEGSIKRDLTGGKPDGSSSSNGSIRSKSFKNSPDERGKENNRNESKPRNQNKPKTPTESRVDDKKRRELDEAIKEGKRKMEERRKEREDSMNAKKKEARRD